VKIQLFVWRYSCLCGDTAVCVEIQLFEVGANCFRFLSVGMDEKRSLQRKVTTRDELVARIMNSAALIKQERLL
jgi:hypothetical protein